MISLRYHVVSIGAVFLALAVGVVLGSTTLSGTLLSGLNDEKSQLGQQVSDLQDKNNGLNARLARADDFAKVVGPMALRGSLDKRTVVVISTDDARPADRDAIKNLVKSAGAMVTGEVQLTSAFSDPSRTDQLRGVVTRLLPTGVQLPTAGDPGTLAGGLIGPLVLISKENNQPQASDDETSAAFAGLTDGGFVKVSEGFRPAQLAVVLIGGAESGQGAGDRASTIARFATQVDRSGAGTVLAGTTHSADGTGPIGVVRADTAATSILSTVDNVDSASGQIVTVLALREQLEGKSGRYGVAGNAQAVGPGAPQG
ncbi:copper transporter [Labedaea rhizosphaerae]|uniref:Copper transport outer membrane protein MctB n=1 Tax=Labedaea rhizosphaerae TaxID=598644 RepID=A0A4R6RUA0_LABRH|nr:copper transporter [Labedaea rhizosphaerae]TDP90470.1 copper transport outer membrane protein MctB [Labedaea rhizosphaerae]